MSIEYGSATFFLFAPKFDIINLSIRPFILYVVQTCNILRIFSKVYQTLLHIWSGPIIGWMYEEFRRYSNKDRILSYWFGNVQFLISTDVIE